LEYLDGIVYRTLQALGCVVASAESKLPAPSRHTSLTGPWRSVQSNYPQVCPFAPKWMGLIQTNAWWASRAATGYNSLYSPRRRWASIVMTMNEGTEVAA